MKKEAGPGSDFIFDRNVCAMDDFFTAKMVPYGYDTAWILDKWRVRVLRWKAAWAAYLNKNTRTRLIIIEKNEAKKDLKPFYQEGRRMVKGNPNTSDAERIDIYVAPNAHPKHPIIPVTNTPPEVHVDTSIPGRLTFHYWETGRDDGSKAMPHGAGSVECWSAILDHAPEHFDELTHVAIDFQSPLVMDWDNSDRGKALFYVFRWVSPTGEKGPWTVIMKVIIP
jgi:hypothetical protein